MLQYRMWTVITAGVLATLASQAAAQNAPASPRSTQVGVYAAAQATRGQETFAGMCQSCHAATQHASASFVTAWNGRALWDLFGYLRDNMPKSDPGSLSEAEYAQVLAYLLKINGMPAGPDELPFDSVALKTIRFDTASAGSRKSRDR